MAVIEGEWRSVWGKVTQYDCSKVRVWCSDNAHTVCLCTVEGVGGVLQYTAMG